MSSSSLSSGGAGESHDIRGDLAVGWGAGDAEADWGWRLLGKAVRPVSPFYPMDPRSNRRVALDGNPCEDVSLRISRACQKLSVHGIWNNKSPSAVLCSMERVEMEVNFYLGDAAAAPSLSPLVLIVEVQRRKGCAVTFHNYRRCILDAAEGKFDPDSFSKTDGIDKPLGRDRTNQPRASLGRPELAKPSRPGLVKPSLTPLSRPNLARPTLSPPASPGAISPMGPPSGIARSCSRPPAMSPPSPGFSEADCATHAAGPKTEGEIPMGGDDNYIAEKALKALNMAAGLIKKDRVDARRLGMESLVLLTDPLRAGIETAKIASRVVLLGSASDTDTDGDDLDALFDDSAGLGIREMILEMIMTDQEVGEDNMNTEEELFGGIEKEFSDSHMNLCLTVLSNALHTMGDSVGMEVEPSSEANASSNKDEDQNDINDEEFKLSQDDPPSTDKETAAKEPNVPKRFINDTHTTFGCDVLSSLIRILGQAKKNPHDAYHSARCLGVLFKECGNSHRVRARRDLDAKRIVAAALEVGCRSHAKLEDASRVALTALVTDDEESDDEEAEGVVKTSTGTSTLETGTE